MPDLDPQPVRLASVPAGHPYVRAVVPGPDAVALLPDPVPDAAHPERWWPPVVLDAAWIREHADDVDVVHVHFGMESLPEGRLEAALDALEAVGIPLVMTVHDLENPQLTDQRRHERDLDAIVPRADRLVTLTQAAANRIRERWGRDAVVLPHPTLLDGAPAPAAEPRGPFVVGMHLRDLRPSIDARRAVDDLVAGLDDLRVAGVPAVGRVLLNDRTRDDALATELVARLAERPDCEPIVRARPDDDALLREIDDLDVAMLPYAHGTHSGWVELCHDRGVPVVGDADACMAEQHPGSYAGRSAGEPAARALRVAIELATRAGSDARRTLVARREGTRAAERKGVRDAHLRLYRSLVSQTGPQR